MYTDEKPEQPATPTSAFDSLFSQQCANEPHAVYSSLHESRPVIRTDGMFGVHSMYDTRYEDV